MTARYTYRCRMCGSAFDRDTNCPMDEIDKELIEAPFLLLLTHKHENGLSAGVADLIGYCVEEEPK